MDTAGSSHGVGGGDAQAPRLHIAAVSKTFGRARVLRDVELEMQPGELHALVGQNGSGKSTLVKILTGIYAPDHGAQIEIDGESLATPVQVPAMRAAGLSVVHQTLGLIEDATVTENVRAGKFQTSRFARRIDWARERRHVEDALARLGRSLDLNALVGRLSAEDRATVAIARALQEHSPGRGVIIFDESTRALRADAYTRFYEVVQAVRSQGASVLLISHRLEEVLEVSDRVTVLKDGEVTGAGIRTSELDEAALTKLMIGRDLRVSTAPKQTSSTPTDTATVTVRDLSGELVSDLSFEVKPGEVLGVTGLIGAGYEEVPYLLAGAARAANGTLSIDGSDYELTALREPVRKLASAGVALVPERRAEEGLAMDLSVADNITVPRVHKAGGLWVGQRWQREEAQAMIDALEIRPPAPDAIVGTLSGGNQQKVLLGKWLVGKPRLLLLHEPTQAVDVGARQDIVDAVRRAADDGCAVIVAGSDPHELAALCDRVLVLRGGAIAAELTGDMDEDTIVYATFGRAVTVGD